MDEEMSPSFLVTYMGLRETGLWEVIGLFL
jgi:hypothetical protein